MTQKKHPAEVLAFPVNTWVTREVKEKLYEIAERDGIAIAEIARRILAKGVEEYEEVQHGKE